MGIQVISLYIGQSHDRFYSLRLECSVSCYELDLFFPVSEDFAQIHKNALGTLQSNAVVNCDVRIVMLVHFDPDPASKSGMENLEPVARPIGDALGVREHYASEQSVMGDAEAIFRFDGNQISSPEAALNISSPLICKCVP